MSNVGSKDTDRASYPLIGREHLTEEERAIFLQAARDQEKAYDAYVAYRGPKDDYPHEHLPDMEDPQHQFHDPNHPVNVRQSIAYYEFKLGLLEQKLNDGFISNSELIEVDKQRSGLAEGLEAQKKNLEARLAEREAGNIKNMTVKTDGVTTDSVVGTQNNNKYASLWNLPTEQQQEFLLAHQSGMEALRSGQHRTGNLSSMGYVPPSSSNTSDARALFTNDKEGPTHTPWHRQQRVHSKEAITAEELQRAAASYFAEPKRAAVNAVQAGGDAGNTLQQAARTSASVQAGEVPLESETKKMLSALPVFGKAFAAHTLAPLGTEAILQADAAQDVLDRAEKDAAKGLLTDAQLAMIKSNTQATAAQASAAALVPEPGLGMDKIVQLGDQKLVTELVQAGLSEQRARQYEMGSMIASGQRLAAYASDALSNRNDVKQMVDADGAVPLPVIEGAEFSSSIFYRSVSAC